jgi:hypothetical protein
MVKMPKYKMGEFGMMIDKSVVVPDAPKDEQQEIESKEPNPEPDEAA